MGMIKFNVSEQTLRYAKTKRAKMLREEELENKVNTLQRQIYSGCNNIVTVPKYRKLRPQ